MSEKAPMDEQTAALVKRLQTQNMRMADALSKVERGLRDLDVDPGSNLGIEIDDLIQVCRRAQALPVRRKAP
jgi:hypothetical protein